jgi:hypothetical protein
MFATLPVDSQFDTLIGNDIGYDLFDQEPYQTLLGSIISRRIGPGFRKALGPERAGAAGSEPAAGVVGF